MERDLVLQTASCFSVDEFSNYYARNSSGFQRIREFEHSLVSEDKFSIKGFCAVCARPSTFEVDLLHCNETPLGKIPNWRERLICQLCGLNNRNRAVIGIMKSRISAEQLVYFTENNTATSSKGSESFHNFACSDYLSAGPMSFKLGVQSPACGFERYFDAIGCFDMLDRVGQPKATLADLHRRLRPGGRLFLTVPFLLNSISSAPSTFGWDLLEMMTEVGFIGARVELYWSYILAHLGAPQMVITAGVRRQLE